MAQPFSLRIAKEKQMPFPETEILEDDLRLQSAEAPPIDAYEEFTHRDGEMRRLDLTAILVGTIMALGPLSVYSVFGS